MTVAFTVKPQKNTLAGVEDNMFVPKVSSSESVTMTVVVVANGSSYHTHMLLPQSLPRRIVGWMVNDDKNGTI